MDSPHTDLAMEARARKNRGGAPDPGGIRVEEEDRGGVSVCRVHVETEAGAKWLGKPVGTYVTLTVPALAARDREGEEEAAQTAALELRRLLPENFGPVMVVGLGNGEMTADALGPLTARRVMATRHLIAHMPDKVDARVRPVSVVTPGVLAMTGVESAELVRGAVEAVKPACVVAVDALAALDAGRLGRTVQFTSAGISPGSGLGNRRSEVSEGALKVPVIAAGVPTVVYAATLAREALESAMPEAEAEKWAARWERERGGELVVTPKEIDVMVRDAARLLAMAINLALHPGVTPEEVKSFLH